MLLVVAVMLSLGRVQGAFRSGSVVMTQPDAIYNNQYLVEANVTTGALIGTYAPSHLKMALQPIDLWWLSRTTLLLLDFARGLFTVDRHSATLEAQPFIGGKDSGMSVLGCPWSLAASPTSVFVVSMGLSCNQFPRIPFLTQFSFSGQLLKKNLLQGQIGKVGSVWAMSDSELFVAHSGLVESFSNGNSTLKYDAFTAAIWDIVVVRNGMVFVSVLAPDAIIVFPLNSNVVKQTIWMQGKTGQSGIDSSSAPNSFLFAPPSSMWVVNSGNNGTNAVQHFVNGVYVDGFGGTQCGQAPGSDYLCGPFNGFKFTP